MKKDASLWGQISREIRYSEETTLPVNPNFAETNKELLELIELYYISRFRDGGTDANNYKKGFYNIVEHACQVASKMIDLDTKDINVIAEDGQSYYPSWFFERELRLWMKNKKNKNGQTFGQFLNRLVAAFPKYGHLVVKKVGDTVHLVPIKNMGFMPEARCILESPYILEKHEYTPWQLREKGKKWKNVEKVIGEHREEDKICVYERLGTTDLSDKYNYFIIAEGSDDTEILYYDNIDRKDVYKELKWDHIDGRALGRGQVERLFENQIAKNLFENLLRTGLRWTSKHIFQTRDTSINKNLLTGVENGDLIIANQEIGPVPTEERNLSAYDFADSKWDSNTRNTGFTHETLSGARPPAGTPLGTSLLQTQQAGMYYEFKREELGMFIKDILIDWILPSFQKEVKGIDKIMKGEFSEGQLETIHGLLVKYHTNESVIDQIKRTGRFPSRDEIELQKGLIAEQIEKKKEIKIPKEFFKNLRYKIDINITGERIDSAGTVQALERILMLVGQNPMILQEPNFRKLLYQEMDLLGITPIKFEKAPKEMKEALTSVQPSGSVARIPGGQTTPANIQQQQTI